MVKPSPPPGCLESLSAPAHSFSNCRQQLGSHQPVLLTLLACVVLFVANVVKEFIARQADRATETDEMWHWSTMITIDHNTTDLVYICPRGTRGGMNYSYCWKVAIMKRPSQQDVESTFKLRCSRVSQVRTGHWKILSGRQVALKATSPTLSTSPTDRWTSPTGLKSRFEKYSWQVLKYWPLLRCWPHRRHSWNQEVQGSEQKRAPPRSLQYLTALLHFA